MDAEFAKVIVKALKARPAVSHGKKKVKWKAEIVTPADIGGVVNVNPGGLFKCVDGRTSTHHGMRGPKTLGGVYAIAATRGTVDTQSLRDITQEVRAAGYVPSVHGDDSAGAMGCGFFKLWSKGKLSGLPTPTYNADDGRDAVCDCCGVYEVLHGKHEEDFVAINFVPKTTLEPKVAPDMRFVLDAWVAPEFHLDMVQYLTLAAQTVELLRPDAMHAKLVVSNK